MSFNSEFNKVKYTSHYHYEVRAKHELIHKFVNSLYDAYDTKDGIVMEMRK